MKQYTADEHVPMKFHNLYVYFLNPIKIIVLGVLTALSLVLLLNAEVIPAESLQYEGVPNLIGSSLLMGLTIALGLAFLFALLAEILLAKRRVLGVTLLICGFLMDVVSAGSAVANAATTNNILVLAGSVLVAALVCIYYWKRARLLH